MNKITLLSNETIDKIAAGEVVERPVNVVKELVENAIDAGATAVTVEIKGGGSELIRVTDNGSGIEGSECTKAFLRHATSKLTTIDDLETLVSLGFRGEALSSISAVSKTEMITKVPDSLLGTHVVVEGGRLMENSEVGAPNGTTVIVRSLFYNTPARRKFLKSPTAEAAMVEEMLEKLALSRPDISVQLIVNSKTKISTPGNGSLKDVIFHVFGRETYNILLPVDYTEEGIHITGFTARPEFSYQARNGEIYFINKRYSKSKVVNTAIEEVYRNYLMKHRFPFCVLYIDIAPDKIDINVHPQKLEVKFDDGALVSKIVMRALEDAFLDKELIPTVSADSDELADPELPVVREEPKAEYKVEIPAPAKREPVSTDFLTHEEDSLFNPVREVESTAERKTGFEVSFDGDTPVTSTIEPQKSVKAPEPFETSRKEEFKYEKAPEFVQESFFDKKLINPKEEKEYRIIGVAFDTYWIMELDDSLYIVDQHAAHEKVNYENFLKHYNSEGGSYGQMISPPTVLHLSPVESETLTKYLEVFEKIGYEIEEFGINSFAIRAIPMNLFGIDEEELFHRLLDELIQKDGYFPPTFILEKLASLSCKAAIKGGQHITKTEMENLMKQMFALDNPYNCPHGRPTFIRITETELEKKFKRIV